MAFQDTEVRGLAANVATSCLFVLVYVYWFFKDRVEDMYSIIQSARGKNGPQAAAPSQPQPTFKEQLDQQADNNRTNNAEGSTGNSVVEKITEYIPAAAHLIGESNSDAKADKEHGIPGPPHRPDDDLKIEEFVREQHRSKNGNEILAAAKQ